MRSASQLNAGRILAFESRFALPLPVNEFGCSHQLLRSR